MTLSSVALVKWNEHDELAECIADELVHLGYRPQFFLHTAALPADSAAVLTFAPYGKFLPIARQVGAATPPPLFAHWNFEGFPNPNLPWFLLYNLSALRSRLDGARWLDGKGNRLRYLGDYFSAYQRGWLNTLAVISKIYEQIYNQHGLPARFVPWGTAPRFYKTLNLERDIDVLWFGKRRTSRRAALIDNVRNELRARGYNMLIADGIEHPFIFGAQRTEILNRAKIVLNVKTHAHNSGFPFRFHMVAGNRALVVSENFLTHVPQYQAGIHFVSCAPEQLVEKIIYYLEHESERAALAENAYDLVTKEMTLQNSVRTLMQHVEKARESQ